MRAWLLACACALWVGGCLYPEYGTMRGGGTAGAGGSGNGGAGGRGGSTAGAAGVGGPGGSAVGVAGAGGGVAGSAGGRGGAAGSVGSAGTTGGASAGRGGTTGAAGSAAGTTGAAGSAAGTGGAAAGRGGFGGISLGTGGTGGAAGRGGGGGNMAGIGGSAGRGGTTGVAGGSAGTGGSGAGGSTAAPNWVPQIAVVYQFDMGQGYLGAAANGDESLHLEEQTIDSILPTPNTFNMTPAIEGGSVYLPGSLSQPAYLQSRGGTGLPSVFQTGTNNSWTTGGWFRITATDNQQWLIHDEGPTNFQLGGFFFYVDQSVGKLSANTAYAYCRVGVSYNVANPAASDMKEVTTDNTSGMGDLGFDPQAGGNWIHLVCRYDAANGRLSILVGGALRKSVPDNGRGVASGPGPFMLSCNEADYCAFIGNMDEVFFATSALSDLDVNRIYTCGIDGSRCRCSGVNYVNCGFLQSKGCQMLPFCNANP